MKPKVTRRHLLKGSLAAPLVMTVRSASATGWAMASAGACRLRDIKKAQSTSIPKFKSPSNPDEWLRKDTRICTLKRWENNKWVTKSGHYFKGDNGCWWNVEGSGASCKVTMMSNWTDANCQPVTHVRTDWGLVCCDDYGNVKGYAWEHPGYNCITKSCWTSITMR